ncbi:hypothetical protein AQUCO_01500473v1 [Aquilegia coerulea]|uniref:Uncharacterized protein n=1 Tax=Aquilegia coerulea TaxID=218851 RepID=A0A2G5DTX5_AQUCA|nr:hypothetical protein AQUCO_01500473v1 [Aquilegia coerulea]
MLSFNFESLSNLHECANDLLRLPITQQALVQYRHERWVDELSEGSLRMLDVCGITRDILLLVKGHLQDIQSALRRRNIGESGVERRIGAYHFSIKKKLKDMLKCLEALKELENNSDPSAISDVDSNLMVVMSVLREVRITTISLLESILSFLSMSKPKLKSRRRFFILNCMGGKRVANASEENCDSELTGMNTTLYDLSNDISAKSKVYRVKTASKRLEALEASVEGLEVELECIFRRLIQTRVSLLNILNN